MVALSYPWSTQDLRGKCSGKGVIGEKDTRFRLPIWYRAVSTGTCFLSIRMQAADGFRALDCNLLHPIASKEMQHFKVGNQRETL